MFNNEGLEGWLFDQSIKLSMRSFTSVVPVLQKRTCAEAKTINILGAVTHKQKLALDPLVAPGSEFLKSFQLFK